MIYYDNYLDGLSIFYWNLPSFHIFCTIISWLSFTAVIIIQRIYSMNNEKEKCSIMKKETETMMDKLLTEDSLQTQYKLAKRKLTEQSLTPEQRSKEKDAEAQQLAAIFKLLKEKSDTFQVDSMDQLEDQLKLYRK